MLKTKDKLVEGCIIPFPTGYKKLVKNDSCRNGGWFHPCNANKVLLGFANDVEFYTYEKWLQPDNPTDMALYLESVVPMSHQGVSILLRSLEVSQSAAEKKTKQQEMKEIAKR